MIFKKIKKRIKKKISPKSKPTPLCFKYDIEMLKQFIERVHSKSIQWEQRGAENPPPIGHYFEFGTWNGDSTCDVLSAIRSCCKEHDSSNLWDFYLFDSFEGLPRPANSADIHNYAGEGAYHSDGESLVVNRLLSSGLPLSKINIIKGFYENTLTNSLQKELQNSDVYASFVLLDCDYYSSTMTALNWIEPLLHDGSILFFDDIYWFNGNPHKGQIKAINEFNSSRTLSGLSLLPHLDQSHRTFSYWRDNGDNSENLSF